MTHNLPGKNAWRILLTDRWCSKARCWCWPRVSNVYLCSLNARQTGRTSQTVIVSQQASPFTHIELVCLILKSPIFVMTTSSTCLCYQALTVSHYFRISERVNTITPPNMYYNTRSVIFHSTAAQLAATPQRIWQNYTAVQSSVVQWWLTVPPITLVTIKLSTFVTLSKFQRTHTTHASHQDRGTWYGSDSRDGCLMIKTI